MKIVDIIKSGKILFFDLDGTVAYTNYANNKAYSDAYYLINGQQMSFIPNVRITRQTIADIPNICKDEYEAIIKEKEKRYSNYLHLIKPNDSIIKLIKECYIHLPLYIITRSQRNRALQILKYLNIDKCFKDIISCKSKNKYEEAINLLGIDIHELIVFENDFFEIKNCIDIGISNDKIIKVMKEFQIESNEYLNSPIKSWYHSEYHGGKFWEKGTIENIICTIKNDIDIKSYDNPELLDASKKLYDILMLDLGNLVNNYSQEFGDSAITICAVPRAKVQNNYYPHQLLFKETIKRVISDLKLNDGTDYLIRKVNTRTTHRDKSGHGGEGPLPYVGITKDTCNISPQVKGKVILLIDDVYTKSINIDEDAIQALLDNGANKVFFYSVGYTI